MVGVDPAERGNGLGRALTLIGLTHLRALGLPDVMLYVDADNTAASASTSRSASPAGPTTSCSAPASACPSPSRNLRFRPPPPALFPHAPFGAEPRAGVRPWMGLAGGRACEAGGWPVPDPRCSAERASTPP